VPPFPVLNRNLGLDGENMLVIGMAGVPVAHISSLAKPAVWGFFLFDLKRALAWYWWLPFFCCFAALWLLLMRCFTLEWRMAAALSATFTGAPYTVVFSGWPAYLAFFPLLGLWAADLGLRARRPVVAVAAGVLLGWAAAGFGLVLYPAWQISVVYLIVPLALAWGVALRRELRFGPVQLVALGLALCTAALLLLPWWWDAHEVVAAIRGTVYPGQRSTEVGGDAEPWALAKGLMGMVNLYRESSLTVASDAGSFVFLLPPAVAGVVLRWQACRRIDALSSVLLIYLAVVLGFMFVGFPRALARWTLWGSTTSYRLDLALGLVQVLMFAWLMSPAYRNEGGALTRKMRAAGILGVLSALWAGVQLTWVPPGIIGNLTPSLLLVACCTLGVAAYLLLAGRYGAFLALYVVWMLGTALPFNPLSLAPREVVPDPVLAASVRAVPPLMGRGGIAVVGERTWAMTLPAAGLPVLNSVFYDPQTTLWKRLDPQGAQRVLYNRYQRLLLVLAPLPPGEPAYRIQSPRLDEVLLTLDPARFDFRLLGTRMVLANPHDGAALTGNPWLRWQRQGDTWTLFEVLE
jgi:hypothetical protein